MFANTDVEANVSFGLGEAKVKFEFEGKQYAMRMSKDDFDALTHEKYETIQMIGVIER